MRSLHYPLIWQCLTWPSTNAAMWHWTWRKRWSESHWDTVTFEFMRSIQFLPSYGSVSHGHPPTQQCDIGHSASFCLCLTERLRPLSSWDLYNLIFKRCGQRPILVFLVNCQNIDTMTTQANVTNYTKIKVGNISAVSGRQNKIFGSANSIARLSQICTYPKDPIFKLWS